MKTLIAAVLFCLVSTVHAHGVTQEQSEEAVQQQVQLARCQGLAMNAAWGAWSSLHGAPLKFIYHPYAEMKKMWDEGKVDYSQGIHAVENDNLELIKNFEGAAMAGWKIGERWKVEKDFVMPDLELITAKFLATCHED